MPQPQKIVIPRKIEKWRTYFRKIPRIALLPYPALLACTSCKG